MNILIPALKEIRNVLFASQHIYQFTTPSSPCYDNEAHPNYSNENLTPCYTYDANADNSDSISFPFGTQDINIAEFISEDFVSLVQNLLNINETDGQYSEISTESLQQALEELNQGESYDLDQDNLSEIIEGLNRVPNMNLFNGMDEFKQRVSDFWEQEQAELGIDVAELNEFLNSLQYTVPLDKVKFYNQQIKLWQKAVENNERDKASILASSSSQLSFSLIGYFQRPSVLKIIFL